MSINKGELITESGYLELVKALAEIRNQCDAWLGSEHGDPFEVITKVREVAYQTLENDTAQMLKRVPTEKL